MKNKVSKGPFIYGSQIYLRSIQLSDASKKYLEWMQDHRVNQYLESRFEKWSAKKIKKYIQGIKNNKDYLLLAIVLRKGDRHVGNVKIGPVNRVHKFSDIGIIIGEKKFWGRGLATEALKLVADYCFKKMRLHKLTAGAYKNNNGSIKAFKKAGFRIEGIRRSQYLYKGAYVDSVLLGIVSS